MRPLIACIIIFFLPLFGFAQQYKKEGMLIINFVGFEDESDKKIIKNHLEGELDNFFDLKSDEEVEEAMVAATLEVDSELCTEEECRKIMGKRLDVDFEIYFLSFFI